MRLKLALVIQLLTIRGCQQIVEQPLNIFGSLELLLCALLVVAGELELREASLNQEVVPCETLLHI